jgi:hypothetical protein
MEATASVLSMSLHSSASASSGLRGDECAVLFLRHPVLCGILRRWRLRAVAATPAGTDGCTTVGEFRVRGHATSRSCASDCGRIDPIVSCTAPSPAPTVTHASPVPKPPANGASQRRGAATAHPLGQVGPARARRRCARDSTPASHSRSLIRLALEDLSTVEPQRARSPATSDETSRWRGCRRGDSGRDSPCDHHDGRDPRAHPGGSARRTERTDTTPCHDQPPCIAIRLVHRPVAASGRGTPRFTPIPYRGEI